MLFEPIVHPAQEHVSLCRAYGEVQERCTRIMAGQSAEIERLSAQNVRLRAALIARETALAYAREDHERLVARMLQQRTPQAMAADLVLCQTGCLGHGNYWRDNDQCRRSGKACVVLQGVPEPGPLPELQQE